MSLNQLTSGQRLVHEEDKKSYFPKKYSCDKCEYNTNDRENIRSHVRNEHKEWKSAPERYREPLSSNYTTTEVQK